MGTWSCSITGNDTAKDLIREYEVAFQEDEPDEAVTKIFNYIDEYFGEYLDEVEMANIIYSLADFMWNKGVLTEEIKKIAIDMIDSNYGLDIFEEQGDKVLKKRMQVLKNFKKKLLTSQPKKKKITLSFYTDSIFNPGDVITYKLKTKDLDCSMYEEIDIQKIQKYHDKYIVLRKLFDNIAYTSSINPKIQDKWAVFQILPIVFDNEPKEEDLIKYFDHDIKTDEMIETESKLFYFKKRDYKLLGNVKNYLQKEYSYDWNNVSNIYFSINKPWYHSDIEIIKKIDKE